jgi:uncharacterized protein (DUF885 family)
MSGFCWNQLPDSLCSAADVRGFWLVENRHDRKPVMKTFVVITAVALSAVVAFGAATNPPGAPSADAEFTNLADEFITGYLAWRPLNATTLGFHEYDGKITDFSRPSIEAERARLRRFEQRLAALDPRSLSPQKRYDWQILLAGLRGELFQFDEKAIYTRNPMTYAGALDLNIYAKRDFAPAADRLRSIVAIEKQAPAIFAAARANLDRALPKPYVETAIEMAKGAADFLSQDLVHALRGVGDVDLQREFAAANGRAVTELRDFAAWLEQEKMPKANAPFALGRENFEKMLRETELIDWPAERILKVGLKELRREQKEFADTARLIDPKKEPIAVFKAIQRDHPTEERLIPDVRNDLDAIRQFVVGHHIIEIPSPESVRVEETPRYLRALFFAATDPPGPFETRATQTFYYVTPVAPEWTSQQKEEWLTSFNYYTADVVSIHEAYPGHFVQFLWLKATNPSEIEKLFGSYGFIEGWAHYCEQMLLDEGFGRPASNKPTSADKIRAAKYRLAQTDEALLRTCRLCVAIKMHCEGMSLEDATRFFQDNCYYERQPAYAEARRGTFDPQYLLYTVGKLEVLKLRRDFRKQEGKNFTLERFHDELLQHGMPPVRLLREQMLKKPKSWDQLF